VAAADRNGGGQVVRFRELVLSDASGGEGLCLAFHPRLTVVAGLPVAARRELVETR